MAKPFGSINFSGDEIEELRDLAIAGISMVEAAGRLQRSHSTIVRHVSKLNLNWRRPPAPPKPAKPPKGPARRPWTDAEDVRLRQLVTAGASIDRAAKELDRHSSHVWRRAVRLGLRWSRSKRPI